MSKPQGTEAITSKVTHIHRAEERGHLHPCLSIESQRQIHSSCLYQISDLRGEERSSKLPKTLHYCSYHLTCSLWHFGSRKVSFYPSRDKSPKYNASGQKVHSSSQQLKLCSTEAAMSQPLLRYTRTIAFASNSIQDCTTLVCNNMLLLRYLQHALPDL